MTDQLINTAAIKLADRVIELYSEDLDRLSPADCSGLRLSEKQCSVVKAALGPGSEGEITQAERKDLELAGFNYDFIYRLSGPLGMNALLARAKWFHKNAFRNNSAERGQIISEMGSMALLGTEFIPLLIKIAEEGDTDAGRSAISSLGNILEKGMSATGQQINPELLSQGIDALIKALRSNKNELMIAAAKALGKIKITTYSADVVVHFLAQAAGNGETEVSMAATEALGSMGQSAAGAKDVLRRLLRNISSPCGLQSCAARALYKIGQIQMVIEVLEDTSVDDCARRAALSALLSARPPLETAVSAAMKYFLNRSPNVESVLAAVSEAGIEDLLPFIIPTLNTGSESDRRNISLLLGKLIAKFGDTVLILSWLSDPDWRMQYSATLGMKEKGWKSYEFASKLIPLLGHNKDEVAIAAANTLGSMGQGARPAITVLIQMLTEDSIRGRKRNVLDRRIAASNALIEIGADSIHHVVPLIRSSDSHVSSLAVHVLKELKQNSVPPLIEQLGSNDENYRAIVASILTDISQNSVTPILAGLRHLDIRVKRGVINILGRIGAASAEAVPLLKDALIFADNETAAMIIETLGQIGPQAAPAVYELLRRGLNDGIRNTLKGIGGEAAMPELTRALAGPMPLMRRNAIEMTAQLLDHNTKNTDKIAKALTTIMLNQKEEKEIRLAAIRVIVREELNKDETTRSEHADRLLNLLDNEDKDVRHAAAGAIATLCVAKSPLKKIFALAKGIDRIIKGLEDDNRQVRLNLARAVAAGSYSDGIGPLSIRPVLSCLDDLLYDPWPPVREAAANALAAFGQLATWQAQNLASAVRNDENSRVRAAAARAVAQVVGDPDTAIRFLEAALKDRDGNVRGIAVSALAGYAPATIGIIAGVLPDRQSEVRGIAAAKLMGFGPPSEVVFLEVINEPRSFYEDVRLTAVEFMKKLGKEKIDHLVDALKDPSANVRIAAINAIAGFGEHAKSAIPALARMSRNDISKIVRETAKNALSAIEAGIS